MANDSSVKVPTPDIRRIAARMDRIALQQLRDEAARLSAENDDLRVRLMSAETQAQAWAEEATDLHLQLCEAQLAMPAITVDGKLTMIKSDNAQAGA